MTRTGEGNDEGIAELVDLYRRLAALERDPRGGHRRWNAVSDRVLALVPEVIARPGGLEALRGVARTDPDPLVRGYASADADPGPPTTPSDTAAWLAHPSIGLADLAGEVRPAIVLQEFEEADADALAEAADYESSHDSSWLGGAPSGPLERWPVRDDGVPLVHVVQIDLRPWAWLVEQAPELPVAGLPSSGVLQLFHDLETPGVEPADAARGAWRLLHVPRPGAPAEVPADAAGPTASAVLVTQDCVATLPAPEDVDPDLGEAVDRARQMLLSAQRALARGGDGDADIWTVRPSSTVFGHGWHSADEARRTLAAVRPDREPGAWVLLADIAGVGPLDGWFGDEGHLEVWVARAPDGSAAPEDVWVLLR